MKKAVFVMRAVVWLYPGMAHSTLRSNSGQAGSGQAGAWHFISVSKKQSEEIRKRFGGMAKGWGSLRVAAMILQPRFPRLGSGQAGQVGKTSPAVSSKNSNREGGTSWKTSIFPDKKTGTYLLPLRASVRKREKIAAGDKIAFSVEVRV
jgi:hypothetical protein